MGAAAQQLLLDTSRVSADSSYGLQGSRPTGRRPKIKSCNLDFLHKSKVVVAPPLSLFAFMQLLAWIDPLDPVALGKC